MPNTPYTKRQLAEARADLTRFDALLFTLGPARAEQRRVIAWAMLQEARAARRAAAWPDQNTPRDAA